MAKEVAPVIDKDAIDQKMIGKAFRTFVSSESLETIRQTCLQVGSNFEIILKPGDKCFHANGRAIYNKGVTGRFDMSSYPTLKELTGPEATIIPENHYFIGYTIGQSGYFEFWKCFDNIKASKMTAFKNQSSVVSI